MDDRLLKKSLECIMDKSELKFWFLFFTLNGFLFVPGYLLDSARSAFLPYEGFLSGSILGNLNSFLDRENSDVFRLSIDFFILSCAVYLLRNRMGIKACTLFLFLIYLFALVYQIYHQSIEKIYLVVPVIYNDIHLVFMGFSIFFANFSVFSLLVSAGVVMMLFALYFFIRSFVSSLFTITLGSISKSILIALAIPAGISVGTYGLQSKSSHGFQVLAGAAIQNALASYDAKKTLGPFDMEKFLASNQYERYSLKERPNIYLLFIESYGRIVLDDPQLFRDYREYVRVQENRLRQEQWHSSSRLSRSPVSGGRSWISYASVLYGYNFKNERSYLAFLKNPAVYQYTHLLRFLRLKGYRNYRLKSLYPGYYNMPESRNADTNFYAIDQWITFEDLQYTGTLHGFGPAPSDQYSLHFSHHLILRTSGEEPFTLFFLNQNSHKPFYGPEKVVENWQDLNDGSIDYSTPSRLLAKSTKEDYAGAIRYQISYLIDFIVKNGREHDIFLLIGDHQPPVLASMKDGFETPVHIISRDSAFVSSFDQYGFTGGLLIRDTFSSINHEGIYSMFMREFVKHYGEETADVPEYRPNGIEFKKE